MTYKNQTTSYKLFFDKLMTATDTINAIKQAIENGSLTIFNIIDNSLTGLTYTQQKLIKSSTLRTIIKGILKSLDNNRSLYVSVSCIRDDCVIYDLVGEDAGKIRLRGNRVGYLIDSIDRFQILIKSFVNQLHETAHKNTLIIQFYIVVSDSTINHKNLIPFLTFVDILIKEQKDIIDHLGKYLVKIQKTNRLQQTFTKIKFLNELMNRHVLSSKSIMVYWQIDCNKVAEQITSLLLFFGLFNRTVIIVDKLMVNETINLPPICYYEPEPLTSSKNLLPVIPEHRRVKLNAHRTPNNLRNGTLGNNAKANYVTGFYSNNPSIKTNHLRDNWFFITKKGLSRAKSRNKVKLIRLEEED